MEIQYGDLETLRVPDKSRVKMIVKRERDSLHKIFLKADRFWRWIVVKMCYREQTYLRHPVIIALHTLLLSPTRVFVGNGATWLFRSRRRLGGREAVTMHRQRTDNSKETCNEDTALIFPCYRSCEKYKFVERRVSITSPTIPT